VGLYKADSVGLDEITRGTRPLQLNAAHKVGGAVVAAVVNRDQVLGRAVLDPDSRTHITGIAARRADTDGVELQHVGGDAVQEHAGDGLEADDIAQHGVRGGTVLYHDTVDAV